MNRYLEKIAGFPNLETVKSVLTKERNLPGHEAREAAELKQRTTDAHKFWRDHHDTNVREAMTRYHRTGESSHLQNAVHHADEAKWHDLILSGHSKQAVEMPLKDLIKEHKDLVGVLKSNNRAGELKELKEQGAELSKLEKLANALQTSRQ